MQNDITGVVFDLDHTLYDRQATLVKFAAMFERLYPTALDPQFIEECFFEADTFLYLADYSFGGQENVYRRLAQLLPMPTEKEYLDLFTYHFGECATPYPFTSEVLAALKTAELKISMVTNGGTIPQNAKIDTLGIRRFFDDIVISGEVGLFKPDREIFTLAAKRLGLPAENLLFVGDNAIADIAGPKAAGMKTAWIIQTRGWPEALEKPDISIRDVRELIGLFAK